MLNSLFSLFDNILVFDVETTGVNPKRDEIIELAVLQIKNKQGFPVIKEEFNTLIKLSPSTCLPSKITIMTGITEQHLHAEGMPKDIVGNKLSKLLSCKNLLLVAYNAQFDLSFLYFFLSRYGKKELLKSVKMLDVLTICRDRKPYPHKLSDAANLYSLEMDDAHRALNDARVTFELLCEFGKETDDLLQYVNLFGFNPKYGVNGHRISSIKYMPQGYNRLGKLYDEK